MNIAYLLCRAGAIADKQPAVFVGQDLLWSYAELEDRASRTATGLVGELGLKVGDRVAVVMSNRADYILALFACWYAGLIVVPVNAKLHGKEIAYILDNSGAKQLVCCSVTQQQVLAASQISKREPQLINVETPAWRALAQNKPSPVCKVAADTPAWIFYTSGTTGRPKGATLTHRNLHAMALTYCADVDHVSRDDHYLYAAPMSHGAGLYVIPYVLGMARHLIPQSGKFDITEIFELIKAYPNTCLFAAPTMVHRLVAEGSAMGADTANLKTIIYGGGPMYVEDSLNAIDFFGPKLVQIFGQGESPMTASVLPKLFHSDTSHPHYMARIASVGYAPAAVELLIVDENDSELPVGEVGEILIRADTVMQGYWNMPEASAQALRDGYLYTGDMGCLDESGFLTLKDRSKDLIISGGSNVYPREVEEVLLAHPLIDEASVVGLADADWGERVVACIVVKPGEQADVKLLDVFCRQNIAVFKCPKSYFVMAALPKNAYGKVLKTTLKVMLADEALSPEVSPQI